MKTRPPPSSGFFELTLIKVLVQASSSIFKLILTVLSETISSLRNVFEKSLNPNPLDIIAFEHRLYHRGTPVSPTTWKQYIKKYPSLKIKGYRIPKEFNFHEKNKYIIYAQFGNLTGLQSYVYDRSKRKNWMDS